MTWMAWMRSRVLSEAVSLAMALPMGTPAVWASIHVDTDHMREVATDRAPDAKQHLGQAISVVGVLREIAKDRPFLGAVLDFPGGTGAQVVEIFAEHARTWGATLAEQRAQQEATQARLLDIGAVKGTLGDDGVKDVVLAFDAARGGGGASAFRTPLTAMGAGASAGLMPTRPVDELTGAYVHINRFDSAPAVLSRLLPYVEFVHDDLGRTRLSVRQGQENAIRPLFADLAYDAVQQDDLQVRQAARWAIRELAPQLGAYSASARPLYKAMGRREITGRTIPAFNIRWRGFDMDRQIFRAAKQTNSRMFLLEIAASEDGYTGPGHDYEGMACEALAAAVVEGYTGPIYLKMDHTQVDAKVYKVDHEAAVAAIEAKIERGLRAGFMNVDIDASTIEENPRYVELEVTRAVRRLLLGGSLNQLFSDEERPRYVAALTIPGVKDDAKEDDTIRFNASVIDEILGRIAVHRADLLGEVVAGAAGDAQRSLLELTTTQARQNLQYQWDRRQQADNAKVWARLNAFTRLRAEQIHGTRDVAVGAEVGEVGKKFNTTLSQAKAFLDLALEQVRPKGIDGPDVFSVQSGAAHGGQFDADGNMIRDVSVDWNLLKTVSALVQTEQYGYIAGSEQHGFSTVAEAKLSQLPRHDAAEVHLATEYANILLYGILFGEPVLAGNKIYIPAGTTLTDETKRKLIRGAIGEDPADETEREQLFASIQVVEFEPARPELQQVVLNALKPLVVKAELLSPDDELTLEVLRQLRRQGGKFKDIIKKVAHNPTVLQLFGNLPDHLAQAVDDAWLTKFLITFARTNVTDTRELAEQHCLRIDPKRAAPPSLGVARAIAAAETSFPVNPPGPIVHAGKVNATAIAVLMDTKGYRGSGKGKKSEADNEAKRISRAVLAEMGLRGKTMAFEEELDAALGELEVTDAFQLPGAIVNPRGFGPEVATIEDVVEGSNALATNNKGVSRKDLSPSESGATSIRATGPGVEALGIIPDVYADLIVTTVRPEARADIQSRLDPEVDALNPYDGMKAILTMIAEANGLTLDDLEVVIMARKREAARLAALQRIQAEHSGLVITQITDGTVAPGVVAAIGRKTGKHLVEWTVGKTAEGFYNLVVTRTQQARGAVAAVRIYDPEVNRTADGQEATDLSRRYAFSEQTQKRVRAGRPKDAEAILGGKRILTPDDVVGPVEASMAIITDNGWFNLPGVTRIDSGTSRVATVRFGSPEGNGTGRVWIEVDDIAVADVQRLVARGTFALAEPAAADAAVVDPAGSLQALMQDATRPREIVLGDPEAFAAQGPGGLLAWERELERSVRAGHAKNLVDAAKHSAVKVLFDLSPRVIGEGQKFVEVRLVAPVEQVAGLLNKAGAAASEAGAQVRSDVPHTPGLPGSQMVSVQFSGKGAQKAAEFYMADSAVKAAVEARVAALCAAVNKGTTLPGSTVSATHLSSELFTSSLTPIRELVDAAVGPKDWLSTFPAAAVKVAIDPSPAPKPQGGTPQVTSPAAALRVAVEGVSAVVNKRQPDPALLAKLDAGFEDGTFTVKPTDATAEVAQEMSTYRKTVEETTGGA